MTNEMKLLMAMCDALGFEVETTLDYQEAKITKDQHNSRVHRTCHQINDDPRVTSHHNGKYVFDEDGMYTTKLRSPIVDYKLTKRVG